MSRNFSCLFEINHFSKRKQLSSNEFNKINVVGMNCNTMLYFVTTKKVFKLDQSKCLETTTYFPALKNFRHDCFLDLEPFLFLFLWKIKCPATYIGNKCEHP